MIIPKIGKPKKFVDEIKYECSECRDQRFVSTDSAGWTRCTKCPTPELADWKPPPRYEMAKLTDFFEGPTRRMWPTVKRIYDNPKGSFYIHGPVACGKTYCAVAQARLLNQTQSKKILWYSGASLAEANKDKDLTRELVDGCHLFIDDIDKFYGTGFQASKIWGVVDHCFKEGVPITITANQSMEKFCETVDMLSSDRSLGASILHRLDLICTELDFGNSTRNSYLVKGV